ncbi:hypothetical protein [Nocardia aurantia]|nr:hypothetical protein [Nocardia aurantia]
MPADLGPEPHPSVLDDEVVGAGPVRPVALELMFDPGTGSP